MLHAVLFQILAATSGVPAIDVIRDSAGLVMTARQSGYVVVLGADTSGNVRVLFPSTPTQDGIVHGGEPRRIVIDDAAYPGPHIYYAAFAHAPFDFRMYAAGDQWVASALEIGDSKNDVVGGLAAVIGNMSGAPVHFFAATESEIAPDTPDPETALSMLLATTSGTPLITVATDRSTYTPGQAARVTVTAARGGYLLLFAVDQSGVVRVIFPSHPTENGWIPGGVPVDLVRGDSQRTLDIDGPFGTAMLFAAISRQPYDLYNFRNGTEWIAGAINDSLMPVDAERGLAALTRRMGTGYVAHSTTTFDVVPAVSEVSARNMDLGSVLAVRAPALTAALPMQYIDPWAYASLANGRNCWTQWIEQRGAAFVYSHDCPVYDPYAAPYVYRNGFLVEDYCVSPPFEILPSCDALILGNATMFPMNPPSHPMLGNPPRTTTVHVATGPAGGNHPIIGAHPPITAPQHATPALNVRGREPTPVANPAGSSLTARAPSWSAPGGAPRESGGGRENSYAGRESDRGASGGGSSGGNSRDGGSRPSGGGGGGSYQDGNGSDRGSSSGGGYSGGNSGGGNSGGGGYSRPDPSPTGTFGGGYGGPAGGYSGGSSGGNEPRNEPASSGNSVPAAGRPPR